MDQPESAAGGRERAFEAFFDASSKHLVGQAFLLTGSLADAQDLAQETLVRVWARWDRVSRYDSPEAFARRVLFNLAVSAKRRSRTAKRFAAPPPNVDPPGIEHLDLVAALGRLPAKYRQVIILHDVAGLDTAEIARDIGARPGTVRQWLSRGRAALAADLDGAPRDDRSDGSAAN